MIKNYENIYVAEEKEEEDYIRARSWGSVDYFSFCSS